MLTYNDPSLGELVLVGLNDLERRVNVLGLDRNMGRFDEDNYWSIQPNLFNSAAFVEGFKRGYSRATGIPPEVLEDRTMCFLHRVNACTLPLGYKKISAEKDRLILEVRAEVNPDLRFKSAYLAISSIMGDTEEDFAGRVKSEPDANKLIEKYSKVERLMGEICAYLYVQNRLLTNYINDATVIESLPEEEIEGYSFLKIALAQRWFKSELANERFSDATRQEWERTLADQTDESFGRLIDYLLDRYGDETRIFSNMLDYCIHHMHPDSEVYGLHTDAGTIVLGQTRDAKRALRGIFPIIEQDQSGNRVINIEFLPGNAFFWDHIRTKHSRVYTRLREAVEREFKEPIPSHYSRSHVINGVSFYLDDCYYLYKILEQSFPETLQFFPGSEIHKSKVRRFYQARLYYPETLVQSVISRRRLILNEWFDPLHSGSIK